MHEDVFAFAPGRLNLIGEHTDYHEGLALPFAIRQGVTVRAGPVPVIGSRRSPPTSSIRRTRGRWEAGVDTCGVWPASYGEPACRCAART